MITGSRSPGTIQGDRSRVDSRSGRTDRTTANIYSLIVSTGPRTSMTGQRYISTSRRLERRIIGLDSDKFSNRCPSSIRQQGQIAVDCDQAAAVTQHDIPDCSQ